MSKPSDERRTPRWFFERACLVFGECDLDAFAAKWNHQVAEYCTKERSVYEHKPRAKSAWVQPPYSRGQLDRALGFTRWMVLEGRWRRAICLVPMDPSTDWWKQHVARPEGKKRGATWLSGELPDPFSECYRLVSDLVVTIAPPDCRLAFDPPPGMPPRELAKFRGAKQPSVIVVYELPRTGRHQA